MTAPAARMMSPVPYAGEEFRKLRFLMTDNSWFHLPGIDP
jgi:hypothetical protein